MNFRKRGLRDGRRISNFALSEEDRTELLRSVIRLVDKRAEEHGLEGEVRLISAVSDGERTQVTLANDERSVTFTVAKPNEPAVNVDARQSNPSLVRFPGSTCRTFSEFLFSKRTFSGVFEPLLADWANEWMEAHTSQRPWKLRWVCARYTAIFLAHVVAQAPLGMMKALIALWKSAS